jgi:IS5 family transposase
LSTKLHLAVRGLGCPVRFILTPGQAGDVPQAGPLIADLPAEVVIADTAYDADHLRQTIEAKGAIAVIPNNPSRALNIRLTSISTPNGISSNAASQSSSTSDASQPDTKRPRATTKPSSPSPPSLFGSDNCPQNLGPGARVRFGGARQRLRVDIFPDVRQLAVPNGDGEHPVVHPRLIRGFDLPFGEADDQNPVTLHYVFAVLHD